MKEDIIAKPMKQKNVLFLIDDRGIWKKVNAHGSGFSVLSSESLPWLGCGVPRLW
jgi:hypothetical protein